MTFITTKDLGDYYKSRTGGNGECGCGGHGGICPARVPAPAGKDIDFEKDIVRGRGHQRHIKGIVAAKVADELKKHPWATMHYPTFEEFYLYVRSIVNIPGIGNLTVYDIATQLLKFFPGIASMPKDYVYLARGAMEGANILLGEGVINKALKGTTPVLSRLAAANYSGGGLANIKRNLAPGVCVPVELLKPFFPQLTAYEMEDVLCIYKIMFKKGGIDGNYPTMDDFLKEFKRRKAVLRNNKKNKSITNKP